MLTKLLSALAIDRDPDILANIAHVLAHQGFRIATRTSPEDSLEYVRRARPHIVLLDLSFWQDGWGIEILDASPESVVIPVIGSPSAPWLRETVAAAMGPDAA